MGDVNSAVLAIAEFRGGRLSAEEAILMFFSDCTRIRLKGAGPNPTPYILLALEHPNAPQVQEIIRHHKRLVEQWEETKQLFAREKDQDLMTLYYDQVSKPIIEDLMEAVKGAVCQCKRCREYFFPHKITARRQEFCSTRCESAFNMKKRRLEEKRLSCGKS